jgi:hypothetical protein
MINAYLSATNIYLILLNLSTLNLHDLRLPLCDAAGSLWLWHRILLAAAVWQFLTI